MVLNLNTFFLIIIFYFKHGIIYSNTKDLYNKEMDNKNVSDDFPVNPLDRFKIIYEAGNNYIYI